jgi:ornithine racemase
MNRVIANLEALHHNLTVVDRWMQRHDAKWTLVTKALCGDAPLIDVLSRLGVRSMGDSRLDNLRTIRSIVSGIESWYLRGPSLGSIAETVALADISLNSEAETIHAINREAGKAGRRHSIVIMIELGDLREGILPGSLVKFYDEVFQLENLEVVGIGANLGCLAGVLPNIDQYMQLLLYRELLELKFERKLEVISAGTSATLPLVLDGTLPKSINHFRIGEAVLLGTDLIQGGTLPGLRNDAFTLEAELIEIKHKSLVPMTETGEVSPFQNQTEEEPRPGERGYRALANIGELDTDIGGLTPENPNYRIAGASSDITVLNVGDSPGGLSIGDRVRFRLSYAALVRLMGNRYTTIEIDPPVEEFRPLSTGEDLVPIPPVVRTRRGAEAGAGGAITEPRAHGASDARTEGGITEPRAKGASDARTEGGITESRANGASDARTEGGITESRANGASDARTEGAHV